MCRKPPTTATVADLDLAPPRRKMRPGAAAGVRRIKGEALLGCAFLFLATVGPEAAWPFGGTKPAPVAKAAAADAPPRKANAQERAAADRLDPIARSAFWAREAELDPTDASAGIELAAALRLLGHYKDAGAAVGKVLVLYPNNLEALLESARSAVADGQGFYALAPLRQAEKAAPRDWRVYSLMAVARDQNQQPDEARAAYGQAIALSPGNPAVLSNLGLWYATHGHPAEAETYLRQAAAQPDASAQERQNLALVLGMEGKLDEAERMMREDLPPEVAQNNLAYLQAMARRR